jgi:pre-mRNA-splicing factor SYF1
MYTSDPDIDLSNKIDSSKLADAQRLSFKFWWSKLLALADQPFEYREPIFTEAIWNLPGSYKLWYNYLHEGTQACLERPIIDPLYDKINNEFTRSLIFMHKMPRIWNMYIEFLMFQKKYTVMRRVFDEVKINQFNTSDLIFL